jgi:hypothetical protein
MSGPWYAVSKFFDTSQLAAPWQSAGRQLSKMMSKLEREKIHTSCLPPPILRVVVVVVFALERTRPVWRVVTTLLTASPGWPPRTSISQQKYRITRKRTNANGVRYKPFFSPPFVGSSEAQTMGRIWGQKNWCSVIKREINKKSRQSRDISAPPRAKEPKSRLIQREPLAQFCAILAQHAGRPKFLPEGIPGTSTRFIDSCGPRTKIKI